MTSKKSMSKVKPKASKTTNAVIKNKKNVAKTKAVTAVKKPIVKKNVLKTNAKTIANINNKKTAKTDSSEERQQMVGKMANLLYVNREPHLGNSETDWKQAEAVISLILKMNSSASSE